MLKIRRPLAPATLVGCDVRALTLHERNQWLFLKKTYSAVL
jgi:hypothetical protein